MRQHNRLFILHHRLADIACQARQLRLNQRGFISEGAGIDLCPAAQLVHMRLQTLGAILRTFLRVFRQRQRQRAVKMVIEQRHVARHGGHQRRGAGKTAVSLGIFSGSKMRQSAIEPAPEMQQRRIALCSPFQRRIGEQTSTAEVRVKRLTQMLHIVPLNQQYVFNLGKIGFAHKGEPAIEGGQYAVKVIAAHQVVHDLMTNSKTGGG